MKKIIFLSLVAIIFGGHASDTQYRQCIQESQELTEGMEGFYKTNTFKTSQTPNEYLSNFKQRLKPKDVVAGKSGNKICLTFSHEFVIGIIIIDKAKNGSSVTYFTIPETKSSSNHLTLAKTIEILGQ